MNDSLLEEVMKKCPENLREALEVELIKRRNAMHDAGMKKFAITMQNMEFVIGAIFTYNLLADKLMDIVPHEGTVLVVKEIKYHVKECREGGIDITKKNSKGSDEILILPKANDHVIIL